MTDVPLASFDYEPDDSSLEKYKETKLYILERDFFVKLTKEDKERVLRQGSLASVDAVCAEILKNFMDNIDDEETFPEVDVMSRDEFKDLFAERFREIVQRWCSIHDVTTKDELAKMFGISPNQMYAYWKGTNTPNTFMVRNMCCILGLSNKEIMYLLCMENEDEFV